MSTNIDWNQLITKAMKEQAAADRVLAAAVAEGAKRRAVADKAIAPLQDAVDIDDATEAEVLLLKAWKKYRVALNRVPEQAGYPATIEWPVAPA
ncbi:Caudovirales tail fiber assembly protein [compost metagenome]